MQDKIAHNAINMKYVYQQLSQIGIQISSTRIKHIQTHPTINESSMNPTHKFTMIKTQLNYLHQTPIQTTNYYNDNKVIQ